MNYDQKMFQFQQVPNNGAYINAQPVNIQYRFDPNQQQLIQQHPQQIQHQIIQQQPQHIQIQQQPQQQHHQQSHGRGGEGKCPVRGKTSPYGFFVKMCYEEHKKKYPGENVQVTEISKKCAEKWKTMNEEEKRRFYELAQKDSERYTAEIAAYGGEDAMRKKKRAKKDPNAPKRALSAFFFFSNEKRPEVQQGHPEWKVGQIAQEMGRMWKVLTEEQKAIYDQKAAKDKERYAADMIIYRGEPPRPAAAKQTPQSSAATTAAKQEQQHVIVTSQPQQPHQMQGQMQHQQPQMVVIQQSPNQQHPQQQQMHVQMVPQQDGM